MGLALALLLCFPSIGQAQSPTVQELIDHYSAAYRVDPALMLKIGRCESGLNPAATGPSGERGAYQFTGGTWLELAPQIGVSGDFDEAYSAASNVAVAAYGLAIRQGYRWKACGG